MKELNSIVQNYLQETKSSNALMISGKWGCGKTYFVKNTIQPLIKDLGFVPIYVSLNGISSKEELKRKVLSSSILGEPDEKPKDLSSRFKKGISDVFDKSKGLDFLTNILDVSDFVEIDKPVFCFDDLERISKEFSISDVLGYINTQFVEHNDQKVILIGDITKNQLQEKTFQKEKEKLIGWTVEYQPNFNETYPSLVEIFKADAAYYKFLKERKEFICALVNGLEISNLRTVLFFLDCLKRIFSELEKEKVETDENLMFFTLMICSEYREGYLHEYPTMKDLPNYFKSFDAWFDIELDPEVWEEDTTTPKEPKPSDKKEPDHKDYFTNRYTNFYNQFLKNGFSNFQYYQAIYDYIISGYLDKENLIKKVKTINEIRERKKVSKISEAINELFYFYQQSNESFSETLGNVIGSIENGGMDIYELSRVSHILIHLQELSLLSYTESELEKFIFQHVEKAKDKTTQVSAGAEEYAFKNMLVQLKKQNGNIAEKLLSTYNGLQNQFHFDRVKEIFSTWKKHLDNDRHFDDVMHLIEGKEIATYIIQEIGDRAFLRTLSGKLEQSYLSKYERSKFERDKEKLNVIKERLDEENANKKLMLIDFHWARMISVKIEDIFKLHEGETP